MANDLRQTIRDDDGDQLAAEIYQRFAARTGETPQIAGQTCDTTDDVAPDPHEAVPLLDDEPGLAMDGEQAGPGRYAIVARLGRGGGGEVFAAEDARLRRRVAVKVAHGSLVTDAGRMARFAAEARITASLEHPSILPIYDLGRTPEGRLFFTMREASGQSLAELIEAIEKGDPPETLAGWSDRAEVMVRVCEAVAYAHSRGVVHRDIKPSNILLGSFGEVLVVDWGTAARTGAAAGRAVGTPLYMAPEQARGEAADERSDVFGLGATLWQLLTLHLPLEDEDPQRFWQRKRAGELDPVPANLVPPLLLVIASRALAADAAARWPDAAALRDALREWLRNQESIAVTEQSQRELAACGADARHRDFERVAEGFRRALALWSGNEAARNGLSGAVAAHAHFAVAHGDLDLAEQLLEPADPRHAMALAELAAARLQRERQRRRQRWLWPILGLAMIALIVAGVHLWHQARQSLGRWHVVFDQSFVPGADLTQLGLSSLDVFKTKPLPQPDEHGLNFPGNQQLWLPGVDGRGDVRMTAEVEWTDRIDGLEMLIGVPKMNPPAFWNVPPGYSCQFGGWSGSQSIIGVNLQAGPINRMPPVPASFITGRVYRLGFEIVGDTLRLLVDGQEILRHRQILPVGDRSYRHLALRAWTTMRIRRITVERLALPQRSKPTVAGDALAAAGNLSDAVEAYLEVADANPGSTAAEEALAKAYLAGIRTTGGKEGTEPIRQRLLKEYPHSGYRRELQSAAALVDWRARCWDAALAAAEELQAEDPRDLTAQTLLDQRPAGVPEAVSLRLLKVISRGPQVTRLDLAELGLSDISPLAGLRLQDLELSCNRVQDLSPLRGMPLRTLVLTSNEVSDLAPLAGMPLRELMLDRNQISDLSPLAGMPLTKLGISWTQVSDLSPLAGMPLDQLIVTGTPVAGLTALAKVRSLREFHASWTRISDLRPLAGLSSLCVLALEGCPITDLAPLRDSLVQRLDLRRCPVPDISPLAGVPLTEVHLSRTEIADAGALAGKRLGSLPLGGTRIADITRIPQDALAAGGLLELGSAVTDLSPLAGRGIGRLSLRGCAVRDLEALSGLPLESVELNDMQVSLAPLLRIPSLRQVRIVDCRIPGREIDGLADCLAALGAREDDVRQLRVHAALADADWRRLRGMAQPVGKALRLKLGASKSLEDARNLARRADAHLPCLVDEEDKMALLDLMRGGILFWIGLSPDHAGGLQWDDGHADLVPQRWVRRDVRLAKTAGFFMFSSFSEHRAQSVTFEELPHFTLDVVLEWPLVR